MKLSIIIPCHNEEQAIPSLSRQLKPVLKELEKNYSIELFFVDDGCTDKTVEQINKFFKKINYMKVLVHPKRMNLGGAMKTGFNNSKGDLIAFLDSDCTYEPKILIEMLKQLGEADIITASPYHPKGKVENVPGYRLFLSNSVSILYKIILNSRLSTFTALVRVYKKNVPQKVKFDSNDFMAIAELLSYAILKGFKVKEFPTVLHARKYGQSKMRVLDVMLSHWKLIFKLIGIKLRLTKI